MDRTASPLASRQTYGNTEPAAAPSPRWHSDEEASHASDGADETTTAQRSCPPLRRDAATYRGPDQPAWLDGFLTGKLTPDLDFKETARQLWEQDLDATEDLESWLDNDENREETMYFSSGGGGIDTYSDWCFENGEPGALLWLFEKKNENFFRLDFGRFGEGDRGIWLEALATDGNIQELALDNAVLDLDQATMLKDCLRRKKNLVSLDIRGLRLPDGGICPAIPLAQGIASSIGLKKLTLQCCEIHGADWTVMMEMIKGHPSLESLHIVKSEIATEDLLTILQNTRANPGIRELGFHTLTLPPQGATVIAESLARDASLTTLEIVNVGLDGASGAVIAKALANNVTLAELNLSSNALDAEFSTACGHFLEQNRCLQYLDLSENQLSDQGAKAIADGLRKNQTLLDLMLSQNDIRESGGLALASMLASNVGLIELHMGSNPCGEKVGTAMAHGLAANTTLQYLGNSNCGFSDQAEALIETINSRNHQARASRERDAMLFSRHGAGPADWLPPEVGGSIMNYLLMQSATNEQYESAATVVELALNAMAVLPQEKHG